MVVFEDRVDAGTRLARELETLRGQDVVVLGLPRGGVPVASVVAEALDAPLDVIVVRKLGVPFQPELAMGAIGEGGVRVLDRNLVMRARVTDEEIEDVERRERAVLDARVDRLRRGRPRVDLHGRVAVVVDDGIATGATARVACQVARRLGAARVVLAVPVAPAHTAAHLPEADDVVCVSAPEHFRAVGAHYVDFSPTSDDEVVALLDRAGHRARVAAGPHGHPAAGVPRDIDEQVAVPAGRATIEGHLRVPAGATAVVVFAHGSGSSRHSPRNRFVADVLHDAGLGTLLLDLLTPQEERDRGNVFDIPLLASRLEAATAWLASRPDTGSCRIGWFGASTGAGAALWAAAEPRSAVVAVVSRGGRPDLAGARLASVRAPTLLIVGGDDDVVLRLNRQARAQLVGCVTELAVVPGATHLFEEPGTLAEAASLARDWFVRHLAVPPTAGIGKESA
ncbi:putative phosphoribosyl transferase [Humibacillus xanthopallidus]|uniref:Putative phosphoribosyl transferase n=1 Tax=Humibacillus xanthopallidus TaxID=412689 RepID=A0A543PUT4_9MICO|nr:phosphoribosyltransferase [Humibacillus xanthopallidus]TQN47833.1 putative phosphoribosyl transferase [Humibacillus xanthopallidus]